LRSLGQPAASLEIAARCGPVKNAKWSLETVVPSLRDRMAVFSVEYPSGADDTVAFDMTTEGGVWKIASIHTSAEPVRRARLLPKLPPAGALHEPLLIDPRLARGPGLPV